MGTLTDQGMRRRLASNVRRRREAAKLTLEQASALGDLDWRQWQKVEAGTYSATLWTITRCANALGIDPSELIAPDKPRVPPSA